MEASWIPRNPAEGRGRKEAAADNNSPARVALQGPAMSRRDAVATSAAAKKGASGVCLRQEIDNCSAANVGEVNLGRQFRHAHHDSARCLTRVAGCSKSCSDRMVG